MTQRLTVVHAVPDLRASAGGIAAVLPQLCLALREEGVESHILALAVDDESALGDGARRIGGGSAELAAELARHLVRTKESGRGFVVHSHGLWSVLNHRMCVAARSARAPCLVSLHGMLMPWARSHKALRKGLAWRLYQSRDLARAGAIHVTSAQEAAAASAAGVGMAMVEIPFGVVVAQRSQRLRDGDPTRRFLFLGRIHPVKNLVTLVQAFADAALAQARLDIVGPDEVGHRRELEQAASALGVADRVSFGDAVFGDAKRRLFERADVLVLPSHCENFGAVVGEALAHGVPAIASTGTPWSALASERCGWWTAPDRAALCDALREAAALDLAELRALGERGRTHVETHLGWRSCARRMASVYTGLVAGRGERLS
jgi:glycosyltransferase involved in cell wall biosynthesis